jgi:D-alanyl-D-alanine carboxypeptidase
MWPRARARSRLIAAVLVLTVGFAPAVWEPASAANGPSKGWRHDLQGQLDRMVEKGVPGAIALVRDGRSSWAFTSGVSNLWRDTPMRLRLRYRIASETKTFVAALALKLSEKGVLTLDDTGET